MSLDPNTLFNDEYNSLDINGKKRKLMDILRIIAKKIDSNATISYTIPPTEEELANDFYDITIDFLNYITPKNIYCGQEYKCFTGNFYSQYLTSPFSKITYYRNKTSMTGIKYFPDDIDYNNTNSRLNKLKLSEDQIKGIITNIEKVITEFKIYDNNSLYIPSFMINGKKIELLGDIETKKNYTSELIKTYISKLETMLTFFQSKKKSEGGRRKTSKSKKHRS